MPSWRWLQPFLFVLHFCYTFQELDHQMKYNFCQYKQSNIHTLGNFNCFQSNLLSCCQQIFYPEDITGFPLILTLPSYGEIISFVLAFHWFFLIICLSRKMCKFLRYFPGHCAISTHWLSLTMEQCALCKTNVSEFCILHAHIHTGMLENEKHNSLPDLNFSLRIIQWTSLKIFSESVLCV